MHIIKMSPSTKLMMKNRTIYNLCSPLFNVSTHYEELDPVVELIQYKSNTFKYCG